MATAPGESDTAIHGLLSPEGVRLDLPVAGPALRMLAYAIDLVLVYLLLIGLVIALFVSFPIVKSVEKWFLAMFGSALRSVRAGKPPPEALGALQGLLIAMLDIAQFTVEATYFTFWEMVTNGRSPGKAAIGLRVVRRDGLSIDLRSSLVRNVMRIVDILPVNYLVGLISMVVSASGERLGDHTAGTIVIRHDRPEPALADAASRQAANFTLTREQIARIGPRELQLIRATLRRAESLTQERRGPLLTEIAETLRARLGLPEPPASDPAAFLRDVLALVERYSRNEAARNEAE